MVSLKEKIESRFSTVVTLELPVMILGREKRGLPPLEDVIDTECFECRRLVHSHVSLSDALASLEEEVLADLPVEGNWMAWRTEPYAANVSMVAAGKYSAHLRLVYGCRR